MERFKFPVSPLKNFFIRLSTLSPSLDSHLFSIIFKDVKLSKAADIYCDFGVGSFRGIYPLPPNLDIEDGEELILSTDKLSKILKFFRKEDNIEILLDTDSGTSTIKREDTEWSYFSSINSVKRQTFNTLSTSTVLAENLVQSIDLVKDSIGYDSGRPYLMMLACVDGKVIACDGFKYQESSLGDDSVNFTVPATLSRGFIKLINQRGWREEELAFSLKKGEDGLDYISVKNKNESFCFKKPKVDFPNLEDILVKPLKSQVPSVLLVRKEEFCKKISQLSGIYDDPSDVKIILNLSKEGLSLEAESISGLSTSVSAKAFIDASWAEKERVAIFEYKDLNSIVRKSEDGLVELRFGKDSSKGKSPLVVETTNSWSMLNQLR